MESEQWKKASLAIMSTIRGLELDQVVFHYDEEACADLEELLGQTAFDRIAKARAGVDVGSDSYPM
jgi:hypothetical protein